MDFFLPLKAMTFEAGFMIADSADIGRRIGLFGVAISMMTTCEVSPTFSRTQMNLSDCIDSVAKPILAALMPTFWSYMVDKRESFVKIGFILSS